MKAILIDDELHVRQGLKMLVNWSAHGIDTILEANDGMEAVDMIQREKPELIFTDMQMPHSNGVEVLEWLQNNPYLNKVIVISGYDDFEFMRKTIQYGGFDYIIKPINEEQLNDTVKRAIDHWHVEELEQAQLKQKDNMIHHSKWLYWNQLFTNMIDQSISEERLENSDELKMVRGETEYQLILMKFNISVARLEQLNNGNKDFFMLVTEMVNAYISKGMAFRYLSGDNCIGILCETNENINSLFCYVNDSLKFAYDLIAEFSVSPTALFPYNISELYQNAEQILLTKNLIQETSLKYDGTEMKMYHLLERESELKMLLYSHNEKRIYEFIHSYIERALEHNYLNRKQLTLWEKELSLLGSKLMAEMDLKETETNMGNLWAWDEQGCFSLKLLIENFKEILVYLSSVLYKNLSLSNPIYRIKSFLEEHYAESITLQEIADHFFLSREYISRHFKKEQGINIWDYLTSIRMEKAKQLLQNPDFKIEKIAFLIGYNDSKYFSKVFKKVTGLSPKQYRESVHEDNHLFYA